MGLREKSEACINRAKRPKWTGVSAGRLWSGDAARPGDGVIRDLVLRSRGDALRSGAAVCVDGALADIRGAAVGSSSGSGASPRGRGVSTSPEASPVAGAAVPCRDMGGDAAPVPSSTAGEVMMRRLRVTEVAGDGPVRVDSPTATGTGASGDGDRRGSARGSWFRPANVPLVVP